MIFNKKTRIPAEMETNNLDLRKESVLIQSLGDTPKLHIIDFLIENILFDFSKKEMIEGSGVSAPTFNKYFNCLEKDGIVMVTRRFGKAKLYKLNRENQVVKFILEMESNLSKFYADEIEKKALVYA